MHENFQNIEASCEFHHGNYEKPGSGCDRANPTIRQNPKRHFLEDTLSLFFSSRTDATEFIYKEIAKESTD